MKNTDVDNMHAVAKHLETISDNKTLQSGAQKYAEWLDGNKTFKKFRTEWDKLPHAAQWAVLKGEQMVPIAPAWFGTMIEMGLLKYKGHASPEDRDEKLNQGREWKQKSSKWALYIASVF